MNTYNTGKVQIGKLHIPAMPSRDCGSISGPHRQHRSDAIVMRASVAALVCLVLLMAWGAV